MMHPPFKENDPLSPSLIDESIDCSLIWLYVQFREHTADRVVNGFQLAAIERRHDAVRQELTNEQGNGARSECAQSLHAATDLGRDGAQP
jgi:hypothetical protein